MEPAITFSKQHRVFVGGIAPHANEAALTDYFRCVRQGGGELSLFSVLACVCRRFERPCRCAIAACSSARMHGSRQ